MISLSQLKRTFSIFVLMLEFSVLES
uniref:Uncharacterized protein n=1 Tax=Arundo donax TaxID=35708 RepID=A0A0A9AI23_ARUDO